MQDLPAGSSDMFSFQYSFNPQGECAEGQVAKVYLAAPTIMSEVECAQYGTDFDNHLAAGRIAYMSACASSIGLLAIVRVQDK
jgi:hypothetical protein